MIPHNCGIPTTLLGWVKLILRVMFHLVIAMTSPINYLVRGTTTSPVVKLLSLNAK